MAAVRIAKPKRNPSDVWLSTVETARPARWRGSQLQCSSPEAEVGGNSQPMGKSYFRREKVLCAMDTNIGALTWLSTNLPASHTNSKLKLLIEDLFERIFPHGVCQLIREPTHAQQGIATKCLDHIYATNPEKLSEASAEFTGLSDHKLIKVSRYSKTLKNYPRYVRKRCFKNFNKKEFIRNVRDLPELREIVNSNCPNHAAELLTEGLSRVMDAWAPIRTIQNRSNYAPQRQHKENHGGKK